MDRKKIIQLVIIVIAFGGSAIVLYNGLFKKPNLQLSPAYLAQITATSSSDTVGGKILPYGNKFEKKDLDSVLYNHGLVYGSVQYPILDPAQVGIPPENLILPSNTAAQ